jgi:hypothetical protein
MASKLIASAPVKAGSRRQTAGMLGENIAINELLWHGWLPVNVNVGLRNAPNIDIIAARGDKSVHIQVKASADKANDIIEVGRGMKDRFFNAKNGPLAHFVVFLKIRAPDDYECYVVPVDVAEKEVSRCYHAWNKTPKRDGAKRSENFPAMIYLSLNKNRPNESNCRERWKKYLNAWQLLDG